MSKNGESYFLYHSIGIIPDHKKQMCEMLEHFADVWSTPNDSQWPTVLTLQQEFIDRWTALIDAPKGALATIENVTTGLFSLIGSLPEGYLRGKRVLIGADCFPSLHFLLSGIARRFGFTLDTVPLRAGSSYVEDEDYIAHWQSDVGLALLTWVSSTTSHRCDPKLLVAHGKAVGSLTVLDITQGVGIVPLTVSEVDVDAVISTSLKWIGGTAGAGILYVRPELLLQCQPEFRGWFSQDNPFSWDLDSFTYARDARRFDNGTPAPLAAIATLPALRWLEATGIKALRAHNLSLSEQILTGVQSIGLKVLSPLDSAHRGGSVMIQLPEGIVGADLVSHFRAKHVYTDVRSRTLRLSPGAVTTSDGVRLLFEVLNKYLELSR